MKTLKAFIRPFETLQESVKIKILVNFCFNTTFWNEQGGKDKYFVQIFWVVLLKQLTNQIVESQ